MTRLLLAIVVCGVAMAPGTQAGRFYLGGGAGSTNAELTANTRIDFDGTGYQLFTGFEVMRYFAVELGYTDFGNLDTTSGTRRFEADVSNVAVWGIGLLPATPHLGLYGRLGYAVYDSRVLVEDGMSAPTTTESDGNDIAWGFGVSYNFTQRFAIRLEWENYRFDSSDELTFTSLDVVFKF